MSRGSFAKPNESLGMELLGLRVSSGGRSLTDVVKVTDPVLVFQSETKANQNRIKGI